MKHEFMLKALQEAEKSGIDIPIGAVIVKDGEIIAAASNNRERENKTYAHAEIAAVSAANEKFCNWRLKDCEMYVTLEPCPMCAAAILYAGIKKIYFGAYDSLYGAFGSKIDMRQIMNVNAEVKGGIMEEECSELLKKYFQKIRK